MLTELRHTRYHIEEAHTHLIDAVHEMENHHHHEAIMEEDGPARDRCLEVVAMRDATAAQLAKLELWISELEALNIEGEEPS